MHATSGKEASDENCKIQSGLSQGVIKLNMSLNQWIGGKTPLIMLLMPAEKKETNVLCLSPSGLGMLCLYGTETQVLSRIANLYHENKHPRYQSIFMPNHHLMLSYRRLPLQECGGPFPRQVFQTFTTCLTVSLQSGQSWFCISLAHSSHVLRWPQGKKTASISFSQQMVQK